MEKKIVIDVLVEPQECAAEAVLALLNAEASLKAIGLRVWPSSASGLTDHLNFQLNECLIEARLKLAHARMILEQCE